MGGASGRSSFGVAVNRLPLPIMAAVTLAKWRGGTRVRDRLGRIEIHELRGLEATTPQACQAGIGKPFGPGVEAGLDGMGGFRHTRAATARDVAKMPPWRNGRRHGLKIRCWATSVGVRVPPAALTPTRERLDSLAENILAENIQVAAKLRNQTQLCCVLTHAKADGKTHAKAGNWYPTRKRGVIRRSTLPRTPVNERRKSALIHKTSMPAKTIPPMTPATRSARSLVP